MKKLTKKLIAAGCALFAVTAAAFCDTGFNMNVGAGAALSLAIKPYIYEDISFDYEFSNGIALGLGTKVHENILCKHVYPHDGVSEQKETFFIYNPYLLFQFKKFTMEGGISLNTGLQNDNAVVPFIRIGSDIPIWSVGTGKLGLDFGAEFWPSMAAVDVETNPDSSNNTAGLAQGIGTVFMTILNMVKVSAGCKYYLPI